MLSITPIASSSAGNCYRVSDGKTVLLLEMGIRLARLRAALDFKVSTIAGVLISHEHGDHAKGVKDAMNAGIDCYMSAGTAAAIGATGHRVHCVGVLERFTIGTWAIVPFPAYHDAAEPFGYLLASGEDKLLFATDTAYIHDRFNGLTHIMIECNYNDDVLTRNVESGSVSVQQKKRLLFSHMGLHQVVDFLKSTDRTRLREVHLLHASSGNSDVAAMKLAVQGVTGCPVYIAAE